ncbi:MAG TPA: bifunctional DNA primase/polymerase [Streptosporangiaceae bacterium]|nr:bifunctional DNA primase/polymerase [Streptosporangiaceae bacterium]
MSREGAHLRAALAYARTGWRVFPAVPQEKVPACAHGVKDATTDPEQITRWWARNPDRNVAIATGAPGPDVLDIDRRADGSGYPALSLLRRERLIGRERAVISTPSGGLHLYYRGSDQGNGSLRGHHLDFRSAGGYVVAPPSEVRRATDGQLRPYLVVRHQASTHRIDWAAIKQRLDPQPERAAWTPPPRSDGRPQTLEHLVRFVAGQAEGNRDAALYWACCRALDHRQPSLLPALARAAQGTGLSQREIDRTIQSARQTGRQDLHATPGPRPAVRLSEPRDSSRRDPSVACHRKHDVQAQDNPGGREPGRRSRAQVTEPERDLPEPAQPERARPGPGGCDRALTSDSDHVRPFERSPEREAGG